MQRTDYLLPLICCLFVELFLSQIYQMSPTLPPTTAPLLHSLLSQWRRESADLRTHTGPHTGLNQITHAHTHAVPCNACTHRVPWFKSPLQSHRPTTGLQFLQTKLFSTETFLLSLTIQSILFNMSLIEAKQVKQTRTMNISLVLSHYDRPWIPSLRHSLTLFDNRHCVVLNLFLLMPLPLHRHLARSHQLLFQVIRPPLQILTFIPA